MPLKLTLQSLSEWISDCAEAAKGAVDVTLESGLLRDSLDELCDIGGVAGALFKLGARAIPDPTPEQRIAARLHKAFLTALDRELAALAPKVHRKSLPPEQGFKAELHGSRPLPAARAIVGEGWS